MENSIFRHILLKLSMFSPQSIDFAYLSLHCTNLLHQQKKQTLHAWWPQSLIFDPLFSPLRTANSSPKIFGPNRKRIEGLSIVEQNELKGAAWFQAGIPREISLEVLSRQSPGAFLVRQSSTKPGCFALSLRVPPPAPKVAHYLILRTSRGYKIKVSEMPCICALSDPISRYLAQHIVKPFFFSSSLECVFAFTGFH